MANEQVYQVALEVMAVIDSTAGASQVALIVMGPPFTGTARRPDEDWFTL